MQNFNNYLFKRDKVIYNTVLFFSCRKMSKTHLDVDMEAELEGIEDSDEDMDKVHCPIAV